MDSNKRRQILTGHTGSVHALVVVRKLLISGSPEDQSIKVPKQKAFLKRQFFFLLPFTQIGVEYQNIQMREDYHRDLYL